MPAPKNNKFAAKPKDKIRTVSVDVPLSRAEKSLLKARFPARGQLVRHVRALLGFDN